MKWATTKKGFTIVELLIVVVVIAILAAITVVAYNGITERAKTSAVISTLRSAATKIESYQYTDQGATGVYPSSLSEVSLSSGTYALGYYPANANQYYCINASTGSTVYYQTSTSSVQRPGACPTSSGLTHWWPLNSNTIDYALGTNVATTVYTVTPAVGQNGEANGAFSFANGGFAYIDTNITGNRSTFSFSIWIKPTVSGGYRAPLSEARDCCGSGYKGFELRSSYTTDNAQVALWNGGSGSAVSTSGATTVINAWNFFAATYDGSTLRFYKDGALISSANYAATIGNSVDTLKIGRTGASTNGYYAGSIDDIRVYNRALTASELSNMYTVGAQ